MPMAPGLMANVPIGVPPPNMQSLLGPGMMQTMLGQSVNPLFGPLTQIPLPAPAAPSDKPNATGKTGLQDPKQFIQIKYRKT